MKNQIVSVFLIGALLLSQAGCSAASVGLQNPGAEPAAPRAAVPSGAVSDPVTKEGAEEIALAYLGLSRDQVKRLHSEYEIDDGIGQYDVQFISGDWEYEFEIHAETGTILSFDRDSKYH